MFQTNIRALDNAERELQNEIRSLNQAVYETERIVSQLGSMSGMEQVRYSLRKQVDRIENERKSMQKMLAVLNQIERCYVDCENRIIDYAENTEKRKRKSFEWFDISVDAKVRQAAARIRY